MTPSTDLNYYEFSAKITQNIYDFGNTASKYDKAKNQVELANISSKNTKSTNIWGTSCIFRLYQSLRSVRVFKTIWS